MSANIRRMSCLSPYWSIACITTIHTVCTKEDRKYRNGSGCIWLLRFNNESVCCVSIDIFDGFLAAFHKVIGICMFIVNDNNNNKKRPKWTQTNEYCRQVSLCAIQWTDVCACMLTTSIQIFTFNIDLNRIQRKTDRHWEENIQIICMKPK